MSSENNLKIKSRTFDLNQIGAWLAIAGTLFIFWQFMRDVHKDNMDTRDRLTALEIVTGIKKLP